MATTLPMLLSAAAFVPSLVFVNGPKQPHGVSMASARAAGADRLIIRFTNTIRPTRGLYTVLAVEPAGR